MNIFTVTNGYHINLNLCKGFGWEGGILQFQMDGDNNYTIEDPDRSEYLRLCLQLGIEPVAEETPVLEPANEENVDA